MVMSFETMYMYLQNPAYLSIKYNYCRYRFYDFILYTLDKFTVHTVSAN